MEAEGEILLRGDHPGRADGGVRQHRSGRGVRLGQHPQGVVPGRTRSTKARRGQAGLT